MHLISSLTPYNIGRPLVNYVRRAVKLEDPRAGRRDGTENISDSYGYGVESIQAINIPYIIPFLYNRHHVFVFVSCCMNARYNYIRKDG